MYCSMSLISMFTPSSAIYMGPDKSRHTFPTAPTTIRQSRQPNLSKTKYPTSSIHRTSHDAVGTPRQERMSQLQDAQEKVQQGFAFVQLLHTVSGPNSPWPTGRNTNKQTPNARITGRISLAAIFRLLTESLSTARHHLRR